MADKIHQRIDEIKASENVEILVQYRIGRCHPLHNENNKRKRTNQYAMDLVHPYRLVFEKIDNQIQIARLYPSKTIINTIKEEWVWLEVKLTSQFHPELQ